MGAADLVAGAVTPPEPADAAKDGESGDGWLRDNLEAVAVAIIMALLIRHFCVEAFRIPTSSMEPTLYGQAPDRSGDRILVNKVGYYFSEPDRWQVVVFKYPLNRARNYIKRIIGLGGDEIDIRGGDIYVNGTIARKPGRVQAELWRPVFELAAASAAAGKSIGFQDRLEQHLPGGDVSRKPKDPGVALAEEIGFRDPNDIARAVDGRLEADARGRPETAWIGMPEKGASGNWVAHDDRFNEIADLRLRATVTLTPGKAAALWLRVGPPDSRFRIRLPVGGGVPTMTHTSGEEVEPEKSVPIDVAGTVDLPAGRPVTIEAAHIDGTVIVRLNGREVVRHEYEPGASLYDIARWDGSPAIGLEDCAVVISALAIDRDIHYLRENPQRLPYTVPQGHYLMLGDNSGSSKDSRLWTSVEFDLTDGTTLRGDGDTNAHGDDGRRQYELDPDLGTLEFVDVTGRRWTLTREQVKNFDAPRYADAPFVPRDNLVGRAFFVFFPLGRVSFIR